MRVKSVVMEAEHMDRTLTRISHEIVERNGGTNNLVLIGIRTRGVPLARSIAAKIAEFEGVEIPTGSVDITLYRDDVGPWRPAHQQPVLKKTVLPDSIDGRIIYLVDDVLFTGRTTRAALDTLLDWGRPLAVRLAVLVDRGHRELPIAADVVGRALDTTREEDVQVRLEEVDNENGVWIGREVDDAG